MAEYKLPDVGEGLTEAEIVSWRVKPGDQVAINDIVVEIETAKSLVELPSPYAGVVTGILVAEGETVAVGTPIIAIGDPSEASPSPQSSGSDAESDAAGVTTAQLRGPATTGAHAAPAPQTESDPYLGMAQKAGEKAGEQAGAADQAAGVGEIDLSNPAASGGGEGESLVGRMKAEGGITRRPRRRGGYDEAGRVTAHAGVQDIFNAGAPPQQERVGELVETLITDTGADVEVPATSVPTPPADVRVLAKPPVRKLAKDLGVDLATLTPSGPNGTISRDDVQSAANGADAAMPAQYTDLGRPGVSAMPGARETREPIKGVRKMMGQAMVKSAFTLPHVTEWLTLDITPTMELVERLRARREFRDLKVSPLLVLARACILAMRRTPEINSFWDDAAQEVVYKGYVNLGIAAATPRGLVVPNVKDADGLSLVELARALGELTATAREGKTQPAEMSGGTFTITNVGPFGVDGGTPIINPGESAILCFGAAKRQPWVVGTDADERIEIRDVCTLALSFDHRHIDGEKGSRFIADVAGIMADPATALMF